MPYKRTGRGVSMVERASACGTRGPGFDYRGYVNKILQHW